MEKQNRLYKIGLENTLNKQTTKHVIETHNKQQNQIPNRKGTVFQKADFPGYHIAITMFNFQ